MIIRVNIAIPDPGYLHFTKTEKLMMHYEAITWRIKLFVIAIDKGVQKTITPGCSRKH